jgi:hypothetical protein
VFVGEYSGETPVQQKYQGRLAKSSSGSTQAEALGSSSVAQTINQLLQQLSRLRGIVLHGGEKEEVQKQLAHLADIAYRSCKAATTQNDVEGAINLLLIAREACPAEQSKAKSKILKTLAALQGGVLPLNSSGPN